MPFNGKIMMELKGRMTTGKEPESCLLITQPLVAAKKIFHLSSYKSLWLYWSGLSNKVNYKKP